MPGTRLSFIPLRFGVLPFYAATFHAFFFPVFLLQNIFFHRLREYETVNNFLFILKSTVMELTGRLTADATLKTTKNGRKVVHFTIAINDRYKPKKSDEWKNLTTYVNCSYWMREGIAKHLTKGLLVEVYGRIGVSAWINGKGEAKVSLDFHVNNIKLHGKGSAAVKETVPVDGDSAESNDDLPF
jgi:single-strand DNA-binding protein